MARFTPSISVVTVMDASEGRRLHERGVDVFERHACAALYTLIAAAGGSPAAAIRPGLRLHEDIGVDSLEMAGLLVDIENHFGVVVTSERLEHIHTVGELASTVQQLLQSRTR